MNTLSSTIIAPALPYISETLNVTNSAEQILLLSIFVLGSAFGPFIACPLPEIYGRSRTIQSWNFLYLVFNMVCGPVNSKAAMLVLRFLAGFFC
jgi:MFS family permease